MARSDTRTPTFLLLLALAVGSVVSVGCAAGSPFVEGGPDDREIEIEVRNQNYNDGTVYAVRLGQPIRLGVVTGMQTETFRVNWPSTLPLRIQVRFVGGDFCLTQEIPTDPGDRIYVEIPANISLDPDCRR